MKTPECVRIARAAAANVASQTNGMSMEQEFAWWQQRDAELLEAQKEAKKKLKAAEKALKESQKKKKKEEASPA